MSDIESFSIYHYRNLSKDDVLFIKSMMMQYGIDDFFRGTHYFAITKGENDYCKQYTIIVNCICEQYTALHNDPEFELETRAILLLLNGMYDLDMKCNEFGKFDQNKFHIFLAKHITNIDNSYALKILFLFSKTIFSFGIYHAPVSIDKCNIICDEQNQNNLYNEILENILINIQNQ